MARRGAGAGSDSHSPCRPAHRSGHAGPANQRLAQCWHCGLNSLAMPAYARPKSGHVRQSTMPGRGTRSRSTVPHLEPSGAPSGWSVRTLRRGVSPWRPLGSAFGGQPRRCRRSTPACVASDRTSKPRQTGQAAQRRSLAKGSSWPPSTTPVCEPGPFASIGATGSATPRPRSVTDSVEEARHGVQEARGEEPFLVELQDGDPATLDHSGVLS